MRRKVIKEEKCKYHDHEPGDRMSTYQIVCDGKHHEYYHVRMWYINSTTSQPRRTRVPFKVEPCNCRVRR